jgi:hypothetical protein
LKKIIGGLLFAGAAFVAAAQPAAQGAHGALSSSNGRYVFGQISEFRKDQFMLDTQTGRLWQIVQMGYKNADGTEGSYTMLNSIPYDQKGVYTLPQPIGPSNK